MWCEVESTAYPVTVIAGLAGLWHNPLVKRRDPPDQHKRIERLALPPRDFVIMKCEVCHLNEASRSIKRVIEGDERELFVCSACSRTSPHAGTVPASLTDVLFSLGMQVGGDDKIEDSVCPA